MLIIPKKLHGPAAFNGGTPVSISLIPEGCTAKILFTKKCKNRKFSENHKIQPHALFKRRTAGVINDDLSDASFSEPTGRRAAPRG